MDGTDGLFAGAGFALYRGDAIHYLWLKNGVVTGPDRGAGSVNPRFGHSVYEEA